MLLLRNLCALVIGCLLVSCSNTFNCKENRTDEQLDSDIHAQIDTIIRNAEAQMPSDHVDHCTGAVPVSLMDSVRYPSRKFHLADRIGYDEFTDESLSITIAHENCDWAVFHVSIFTKAIRQNTSDTAYWSTIAAERLEGISTAIDPTMGIDSLCYYLRHYTDSTNLHLADSKGVVYEKVASDFMSILTIDTIEKPDT